MSKLILCPVCDGFMLDDEMVDNTCPHCGFSFDDEEKVKMASRIYLCPVCGDGYTNHVASQHGYTCKYCNNELTRANINMHQYLESCVDDKNSEENTKLLADKYGNNQFSEEKYHHRIYMEKQEIKSAQQHQPSPQPSIPHCPVCNSTNIEKISFGKKAKGSFLFGFLSSDVRKQMHCRDCGYKF